MKKQAKWLPITLTIAVIVGSGYILFARTRSNSANINQELYQHGAPGFEEDPLNTSTAEQQQAINEGLEELSKNGPQFCSDAITPAVHPETGAQYTFSNGCLPTGWEAL